jgi:hypothetical protein
MSFGFPFAGPYTTKTYRVATPYDYGDSSPANWRLEVAVEHRPRGARDRLALSAVCDGWVSAVPPDQLPPAWLALPPTPDGVLPTAPIRLYLQPLPAVVADPSLRTALESAGLGTTIHWFVYENVSPSLKDAGTVITAALATDKRMDTFAQVPGGDVLTADQRFEVFLEGALTESAHIGDVLGYAAQAGATQPGNARVGFGVQTDRGPVDPVAFFNAVQSFLTDDAGAGLADLTALLPSAWQSPAPQGDAAAVIAAAQIQLYPLPALRAARTRANLSDDDWRAVRGGQKALYWEQLLARSGHAPATSTALPFTFNTADMANPFQLEAVVEFFLAWPKPTVKGTVPPQSVPFPPAADFLSATLTYVYEKVSSLPWTEEIEHTWDIVLIDRFNDPLLGSPTLVAPSFTLSPYTQVGDRCDPMNGPNSPYPADGFDAVLFLLHKGEIVAWFPWTTLTSHMWEDTKPQRAHEQTPQGFQASSIEGNHRYLFRSARGSSKNFINYALLVWDPDTSRNSTGPLGAGFSDIWAPGNYYYRAGVPADDGLQPGDNNRGKTEVFIHNGYTQHLFQQVWEYSASAGCMVSPQFYMLRNEIVALYQEDFKATNGGNMDPEMIPDNLSKDDSEKDYDNKTYPDEMWNDKIRGQVFVIRPDEPFVIHPDEPGQR